MTFEPNKITREHILRAAEIIDEKEYKISPSTGYDVIIRGKKYPPKEIMRFAHELATGKHLLPVNGGESTNKYLRVLGFEIEIKRNYYVLGAVWDSDEKKPDQSER